MKRVKQIPEQPGGANCQFLRTTVYNSMESFLEWKEKHLDNVYQELSVYIAGLLSNDLQDWTTPKEQAEAQQRLNENLGKLQMTEQGVLNIQKCVQNDILQKQQYAGQLYGLQQDIIALEKEVKEMEEIASEAQERSDTLDAPYSKTTRWQSWFPLGRPLQKTSLPVLLSLALVFLVLSFGMFLRLASIDLDLHWFDSLSPGVLSGYGIGR